MTRRGIRRGGRFVRQGLFLALLAGGAGLACPASDEGQTPIGPRDPAAVLGPGDIAGPGSDSPMPRRARRIVSLSPLASRFVVALGVGDRLVAVDSGSVGEPGVPDRPTTRLEQAGAFEADLVLVPALPDDRATLAHLQASGARVVEFAPHDLEDVFALCRGVGGPLVGGEAAGQLERRIARPLSLVAGESPSEGRPRVLGLVSIDPPEIAGGHSFETDLIEIAGGSSLTHGSEDLRRPIDPAELARLAPDLVVVMTSRPLGPAEEDRAFRLVGEVAPVEFFQFDRETFWLEEPARDAKRLRAAIVAFESTRAARERP
jgi:ABC-type hemin transport system substrate-binding protein